MSLNSKNPLYVTFLEDWVTMRDCYRGERVIKDKRELYLPATSGMKEDGMTYSNSAGYKAYNAYLKRAVFHDYVSEAVRAMVGMMHSKPAVIELPTQLESMMENATINGESLQTLLRRINEQQLVTGRLGLLLDLPQNPDPVNPLPYIVTYDAEHILNWDDGGNEELLIPKLNLVVLDETGYERQDNFEWELKEKYRVLLLGSAKENESVGVYRTGLFRESQNFIESEMIEPVIRGTTLDTIPFVFINTKDIISCPDDPPLIGLSKLALAIYRGEADYRQNLFMQGQDTLVVQGGDSDEEIRIGSGAVLHLPTSDCDAKYIGVTSEGLSEQRQSLENDKAQAANKAGQVVDTRSRQKESGEGMRVRIAAQTSNLNSIALSGAAGLESILKVAAKWVGANPDKVKVIPNLDFADNEMDGKTLVDWMSAKAMGAPLSNRSIHARLKDKGVTDLDYDEEISFVEDEDIMIGTGTNDGDS